MDRTSAKLLSLPVFDEPFRDALHRAQFDHFEKLLVMASSSDGDRVQGFLDLMPAVDADGELFDVFRSRLEMVGMLMALVVEHRDSGLREVAADLGYGGTGGEALRMRSPLEVCPSGATSVRSLAPMPKRFKPASDSLGSLQGIEEAEKRKWGARLLAIAERAGVHAKINNQKCGLLTQDEATGLRDIVLTSGAFRTIHLNVRYWERFEAWAAGLAIELYPITREKVLKFFLDLMKSGCGPAVMPAIRQAFVWIQARLAIEMPDLRELPEVDAMQKQVAHERGQELREAVPLPPQLVRGLEALCVHYSRAHDKGAAALFVWWVLIMTYSSLRFNDAVHIAPKSVIYREGALRGVSWQTKADQIRRGTKVAVPDVGMSSHPWMAAGWEVFLSYADDRDYFLWDLLSEERFDQGPISYSKSLPWLRYFLSKAAVSMFKQNKISKQDYEHCREVSKKATWHSPRVTLLSEAVHQEQDEKAIAVQANWKNPGPLVLKYARARKEISMRMVRRITDELRTESHPMLDEADEELLPIADAAPMLYVIKDSKRARSARDVDLKCHIVPGRGDAARTLCRRVLLAECIEVGHIPPCAVCSVCSAASEAR